MRLSWLRAHFARPSGHTVSKQPAPRRRRLRIEALEARHMMSGLSIVAENQLTGTPQSVWDVSAYISDSIQGYTDNVSYNLGETVNFKIDTDASTYRIDIYRMGYYNGDGARLVASLDGLFGYQQPDALRDLTTGLIDAGNWSVSASWNISSSLTSGVYLADLIRTDGVVGANQAIFIVRDDASTSEMLFQTSVSTWQAYNTWGGSSLYTDNTGLLAADRAYAVSFNRPYEGGLQFFTWEYPMVRFIEANGYDVSYTTNIDTDRLGYTLLNHETFLSVGHDEYWSAEQRQHVEAARDAGVNLGFFTGNDVFWKVRYANSIDGSGTPYRTLICYKESLANNKIDPWGEVWTGTWRDSTYSNTSDGGIPENALTGTLFTSIYIGTPGTSLEVSAADGQLRFWRNTDVATLAPGQSVVLGDYILGYEINEDVDNGFRPAGLMNLSTTSIDVPLKLYDAANGYLPGTAVHSMTLYRAASGALVFSAGTIQYSWGLDSVHEGPATTPDLRLMQATVNLFADMGARPGSLLAGLIDSEQSTDYTAPTSQITSLVNGGTVVANGAVFITGTARENGGGVVAGVEISLDGGVTWRKANGRENWSYEWTPSTQGGYYLLTRAVDDSGNIETPLVGVSVEAVGASGQLSLWNHWNLPAVASNADPLAVEVGTRFSSTVAGFVTGIRFYKGDLNIGTHRGHLWSSNGTLLATVTFTSETVDGWQTAMFDSAVAIQANTNYVISYTAPLGRYAVTQNYFPNGGISSGTLRATAGVYSYGLNTFPTSTYQASNYWVDPIFSTTNAVITPAANAEYVDRDTAIKVVFNTAMTASSINASTVQLLDSTGAVVPATVSYNANTRTVTLTPSSSLLAGMSYTVVVRGQTSGVKTSGGVALGRDISSSFKTAAPSAGPEQTLWADEVPETVDGGDGSAIELGMRFQTNVSGYITGVRFYKSAANTGLHTGSLWSADGKLLASVNFTNETASGWQQANFAVPVYIQADTTYVISYFAPNGHYSVTRSGLRQASSEYSLTSLGSDDTPNGLFKYTAAGFPSDTYDQANYWVAPVFVSSFIESMSPQAGDTNFAADAPIVIKFARPVDATTVNSKTISLFISTPCGLGGCATCMCSRAVLISATVSYDENTYTATIVPNAPLVAGGTYTLSVRGRAGGVLDEDGNALANDVFATFSTVAPIAASQSVWSSTTTPQIVDSGDGGAVELGMKFSATANGFVTGVRFYKGAANTGTHVGNLWSADGTLLATVTFTGESASGWQQASFSKPVSIQANTTYIISYYAPKGHYSIDPSGLASTIQSGALTVTGGSTTGVFRYGASGFPTDSYQSSNYWVDVVYVESLVTSITPVHGATLAATTTTVKVAFNSAMDLAYVNGATIRLVHPNGKNVAATVAYDPQTNIATLSPVAPLFGGATYTVVVSGGSTGVRNAEGHGLPADMTTTFSTSTTLAASLWTTAALPAVADSGTSTAIEVGTKFRSDVDGYVTGIRFYKSVPNTGTHVGTLWSSDGTKLATVTFSGESASGWQTATFSNAVTITANTTYVISYYAPRGHYSVTNSGLLSDINPGPLHTVEDGANGVFRSGSTGFPTQSDRSSNYWVDVLFIKSPIASISPATSATNVPVDSAPKITFSVDMNAATLTAANLRLQDASGDQVAVSFSYNATTRTATLTPTSTLSNSTVYTVTVVGGVSGVRDTSGNAVPVNVTSSFTTAPVAPATYSVWGGTGTPAIVDVGDSSALEIGMKFRVTADGFITGVSFYKAAANTGTHTGTLWSSTGTKLATVTFTNETASGWQTATFSNPVAVTANTTYVVSYYAPKGHFSVTNNGLATTVTNGPIQALGSGVDGGNGVYRYGTSGFPSSTYQASNYWVDVVFVKSPIASVTPSSGGTGVALNGAITVVFNTEMNAATINSSTIVLKTTSDIVVPANVSYNATTRVATLTPSAPLSYSTQYTVTVVGGASGVKEKLNYTMPVSFTSSFTTVAPPSVSSISPSANSTNVAITSTITVVFGQAMDATTLTAANLKLQDASGAQVAVSFSYNATTRTATLTPTSTLSNSTVYTVTVVGGVSGVRDTSGNAVPVNVTSSFTTAPVAPATYSVWGGTGTPAIVDVGDSSALEIGMKFRVTADGFITGVSFYKAAANTGTHTGTLWSSTGTKLATVTFTNETASGWQTATFSNPVAVTANTTYVVSYYAPKGHFSVTNNGLATTVTNGPIQALGSGVDGGNGVYRYGTSGFPSSTYQASNYWVDVVFVKSPIASVTPAAGATGVARTASISIAFGVEMDASSLNSTSLQLRNASGTLIPINVVYNSTTQTVVITPVTRLARATTFTMTVKGGSSGIRDRFGNLLPADVSWSFKTA